MSTSGNPPASGTPLFEAFASRQFTSWLAEQRLSLAFTTYQSGKLFLVGLQPDGRLSLFERTFNRCLGLWGDGQTLWMSSLYQLWRFENALTPGQVANGFDRIYVPQVGYVTGDLDIHDVAVDTQGNVVFVNTLFGCLATISDRFSFVPLWRPPFLTKLAAEDRCHLNGLALAPTTATQVPGSEPATLLRPPGNGSPPPPHQANGMAGGLAGYVTCVSQTDVADGWRNRRRDGGSVIDLQTNETIVTGLSMPHSPRLYRDQLWLLDSGTGHFGRVNRTSGTFEPLTFCPGYLRGLSFSGDYAVVGLSQCRENRTFQGLALDDNLRTRGAEAQCGLCVIDLRSGDLVHWLWLQGVVREMYDVVVLPGVRRPSALGFKTDEIRRTITIGDGPQS